MKITIVGAGMAGLIAANMLRRHDISILEKAKSLPNNHTAVLRFKTQAVSDATGIPFTHETVHKGLWKDGHVVNEPTLWDLNRYSLLVTGGHLFHRSIFNLKPGERWCAPRNFVELMAKNLNIVYDTVINKAVLDHDPSFENLGTIISTIPMPFMMQNFNWRDKPNFQFLPVWTIKRRLSAPMIKVCQTLYRTDITHWYRATLHGQELTLEFMRDPHEGGYVGEDWTYAAMFCFGLDQNDFEWEDEPEVNKLAIGKILPIEENVRKRFLLWLTEKHDIYSLGRFATWRNILLDDIVQDVKRIEAMMERGSTYDHR